MDEIAEKAGCGETLALRRAADGGRPTGRNARPASFGEYLESIGCPKSEAPGGTGLAQLVDRARRYPVWVDGSPRPWPR